MFVFVLVGGGVFWGVGVLDGWVSLCGGWRAAAAVAARCSEGKKSACQKKREERNKEGGAPRVLPGGKHV